MVSTLKELPSMKVGDVLELDIGTWVITDIIQVIRDTPEDMAPQISFQIICQELKDNNSN